MSGKREDENFMKTAVRSVTTTAMGIMSTATGTAAAR